ncbi:dimethylargininase [Nocardioides limicola]|uniref:dimethylargininase n=1 Tax=Nocardioides limicola TaxID=2803368 RepID=UPI00193BD3AE|nr:dimethylargininase [Nocardioides sp. DJM-14]
MTAPAAPYALVRPPAASLADGIVTFLERQPIDVALAGAQWAGYVAALESAGWPTVVVEPDDTLPDSVFVEDTVVMFGDLAVLTNPAKPTRNPEVTATARTVRELGIETVAITEGTLDGGDILKVGDRVYAGLTGTTNAAAVDQLRDLLAPRGWTVTAVPVTKALHLKSAVTALPDGTVIGYGPVVDDPSPFEDYLEVPEEPGAHVVVLDEGTVLMSSRAPRTAEMFRLRGLKVVSVDISEFEKLEGCVTCLSVRVRQ